MGIFNNNYFTNSIICPFCLTEHSNEKCNQFNKDIPRSYIKSIKEGALVCPVAVIGYKGCGKTTFLSSLIYTLYNRLPQNWVSLFAVNQSTLDKIEETYIPILLDGHFPPPTSKFFEEPLILNLKFNISKYGLFTEKKEVIVTLFDTMGGNYDSVDKILNNFPLIKLVPNIIVLIDLYSMHNSKEKLPIDMKLTSLINKLKLALDELDVSSSDKNLLVIFTKSDIFWYDEVFKNDFGPIAQKPLDYSSSSSLSSFINEAEIRSNLIGKFLKKKYNNFYEIIVDNFGGYFFIAASSVGSKINPKLNSFEQFNPLGVVDPLLWLITN